MYSRVSVAGHTTASALWNASYDIGMAAGAIGAGVLVTTAGFTVAFLVTAATTLPALVLARREATPRSRPASRRRLP